MKKAILLLILVTTITLSGCSLTSKTWFEKDTFKELKELQGYRFKYKKNTLSALDFQHAIKSPVSFNNWDLLTKNAQLIRYQLEDIYKYGSTVERSFSYIDFTEQCSFNVYYTDISDGSASVLLDYDKNTIFLLEHSAEYKEIVKAIQFNKSFDLKNLQVVGAYYKDKNYITSFIDNNDNILYQFNLNTLELIKQEQLNGLKYISAYEDREYPSNKEHLYIYLNNTKTNELIKKDLSEDKVLYTNKLNENIVGEITEIEVDLNVIFIVCQQTNKSIIYSVRETDNCLVAERDQDEDNNNFSNIDNLVYYGHTARDLYLVLFNKQDNNPFTVIRAYDTEWVHVK